MDSLLLPNLSNSTLAVSIAILVVTFYLLQRWTSKHSGAPSPPEAPGKWPIIGHLRLLSGSQLPHFTMSDIADKLGPIFTIRIGVNPVVVVSSGEVAKELYTKYDVAISSRPKSIAGEYFGYNNAGFGFSPYNAYWRELRKVISSELLSNRRINSLKHVPAAEVETGLKEIYKLWSNKRDVGSNHVLVDMQQWFGDLSMNVILRMIARKRISGGDDRSEAKSYRKLMREFFDLVGAFVLGDAVPFLRWLDLGGHEKAMKKTAKELDSLVGEWLVEHRNRRKAADLKDDQDFVDVLLSAFDGTDQWGYDADTIIKANCMAVVVGGTDTTAVNLTWILSVLLNNRQALKKVQEELDSVIGKERFMINESDINKLVYLQAVVKETLRLCPVGPLVGGRLFTEDCVVAGYHIPKGTQLMLNIWKIQTDPQVWSDPFEFKPERFLTTRKDIDVKGQNFELIPFGSGRRICIGMPFGLLMSHLTLANFLHAFAVSTPSDAPVDMTGSPGLTNTKATPLEVLVEPRLPLNLYE